IISLEFLWLWGLLFFSFLQNCILVLLLLESVPLWVAIQVPCCLRVSLSLHRSVSTTLPMMIAKQNVLRCPCLQILLQMGLRNSVRENAMFPSAVLFHLA